MLLKENLEVGDFLMRGDGSMWIIDFLEANCKNCYACVRACPAHAIKVQSEQANIMKERCIGCGRCLEVCPKNAKHVQSECYKVKTYLQQGEKVIVSLAPSFAAVFGKESQRVPGLLKGFGFYAVEETVVGADLVTQAYETYGHMPGDQCYITSCCPTVNAIIQKHYPEVIPNLIPVVSPAACHSRILKLKYGEEAKVVFIGPCLSKKIEGIEEETLDAVLTFEELKQWMEEENRQIEDQPIVPFEGTQINQRRYPLVGGVTATIDQKTLPRKIIQVDGVEECMALMPQIIEGRFKSTLLEMHGCRYSCIKGAGMPHDGINVYERMERVKAYASSEKPEETVVAMAEESISLYKEFPNLQNCFKQPSEAEIEKILESIGKETPLDELNCGSCGYKTCREKAIAVYNGVAEPNMCLPFMRQKAETLTNVIFESTPNMIMMVNDALEIIEINPAARQFFEITKTGSSHLPVQTLLDDQGFREVKLTKHNLLNQKQVIHGRQDAVVIQSIIWSDYHQMMLWIGNDITYDEKQAKARHHMKIEAIDMAQQVINKQMTVAQEIASLLGETTAETKVTLTKLKNLIQEEEAHS